MKTRKTQTTTTAVLYIMISSLKSAMGFGLQQYCFSHKSAAWGLTSKHIGDHDGYLSWAVTCQTTQKQMAEKRTGVNMTGNKDIKQPDVTYSFPCICPCTCRFTKTVSNNYSLTLSRTSNTSDRERRLPRNHLQCQEHDCMQKDY